MLVMYTVWLLLHRIPAHKTPIRLNTTEDLVRDTLDSAKAPIRWFDLVNTREVDLFRDEYKDDAEDVIDDQERERRLKGRARAFWSIYYLVA